jgi:hypothetical protein
MDEKENSFDPSIFGDAVAMKTQWLPVKEGGSNFNAYKMIMIDNNRIEFKASLKGVISFILMIIVIFTVEIRNMKELGIPVVIFIILIFHAIHYSINEIVFDKNQMLFWKGVIECNCYIDNHKMKSARIGDIHAIQLLWKEVEGDDDIWDSYELNIVLEDSRRIHVVSYAKKDNVRQDASVLARFLDKPLWDAIDLQSM